MSLTITERDGQSGRLVVNGAMTIYEAAAAKTALLDALAKTREIEIDLSGVEEIDTAGVQLLILVKHVAVKAGKSLRLVQHSAATLEVLDRYNLTSYFGDPVVISAGRS
jgi:anti-sigma B factor antagonist